jgi:UDP-N-acetylmuramoyl-tripeptide--D-alanyl-D-alanine ligase
MEVHHLPGGPVLVVDCFNAIPASAEAAVRSLAALPGERKLAVLGLMAELGDQSESEHRRIAIVAEELGIEVVGYETALYGEAHVTGVDEAVALLRTMGPGDAGQPRDATRRRGARLREGRGRTIAHPRRRGGGGRGRVTVPPGPHATALSTRNRRFTT